MQEGKLQLAIKNTVTSDGNVLELYFLDIIEDQAYYDWYYGYVQYGVLQDTMNQVREANPSNIKVIIDSEGGDAQIGMGLYNYLRRVNCKVEVQILGMAGSIASVLAQCANKGKRTMARNGFMVIHQAWGGVEGNSSDLRKAADVIDMYTAQIVDIYEMNNSKGKKAEEIAALIAPGDYWMTGQQALDLGFVDELFNDNPTFQIAARIQTLDAHYTNVPKALKAAPAVAAQVTPPAVVPASEGSEAGAQAENEEANEATLPAENGNIAKTIKDTVVKFSDLVKNTIGKIKAKKIDPAAANLSEEIANQLGEPLTEMAQAMQQETETYVGAQIDEKLTTVLDRVTKLEGINAKLLKDNEDLTQAAAETAGAETSTGEDASGKKNVVSNKASWSAHAVVTKTGK